MNNFIYDIPTKVYFGQGQIVHLPELIQTCGSRVQLVYGGGSVKKTGLYDTITHLLRENGIEWQELSGVQSNPKIGSVREGVRLVREHQLDCVLAVGGGSTLDCSKGIRGRSLGAGARPHEGEGLSAADHGADDGGDRLGNGQHRSYLQSGN